MKSSLTLALACLVLLSASTPTQALYTSQSQVKRITSSKLLKEVANSNELWVIEIFKTTCQFCQAFAPEYERAASKLKNLAQVAAVDIDADNAIARALEDTYNFKVSEVPTVLFVQPTNKGQRHVPYSGPRTTRDVVNTALTLIPDVTHAVTSESLSEFLHQTVKSAAVADVVPKLLLFTSKTSAPPMWKALSAKFQKSIVLGWTSDSDTALMSLFGITKVPAVVSIMGSRITKSNVAHHDGPLKFDELAAFAKAVQLASQLVKTDSATLLPPRDSLHEMDVDQLKELLLQFGDSCQNCKEKADMVAQVEKHYDADVVAANQARDRALTRMRRLKQQLRDLRSENVELRQVLQQTLNSKPRDRCEPGCNASDPPGSSASVVVSEGRDSVEELVAPNDNQLHTEL